MRTLSLLALVPFTLVDDALAQRAARRFPYRATVSTEVYVRSGPGERFYATGKLPAGEPVVVHRHDPGGWYMIAPPPGSFSWIRADYVECPDGRTGIIAENNVVVRVGSNYGDVRDVEQRRLSKGDRVTILGEATIRDERGVIRMFKIAPPRGEYRWISGRSCTPADERERIARNRDPYATPSGLAPTPEPAPAPAPRPTPAPETEVDPFDGFERRPLVRVREGDAVGRRVDPARVSREETELRSIDVAFQTMVKRDPVTWDLRAIRHRYEYLQREARHPRVIGAIPARLAAVKRYGRVQGEYVDFVKLTRVTAQRDAQLVTLGKQRVDSLPPAPPIAPDPEPPTPTAPTPTTPPETYTENVTIVGAGIVQRSITGGASHVLMAPTGRILAYLRADAPGVNMDAHLGRQVGAVGDRAYSAALDGDVIEVRELVPVRLAP